MSKTDRTRPWRVQVSDSFNNKYKHVGNTMYAHDGTSEHYWKRLTSCACHMCSNKKYYKREKRRVRTSWRALRQRLLADHTHAWEV